MGAKVEGLVDAGLSAGNGEGAVGEEEGHLLRAPRTIHVCPDVVVPGPVPLVAPLVAAGRGGADRGGAQRVGRLGDGGGGDGGGEAFEGGSGAA